MHIVGIERTLEPAMSVYVHPRLLEVASSLPKYSHVDESDQVFVQFLGFLLHRMGEICLMSAKVRSRVTSSI